VDLNAVVDKTEPIAEITPVKSPFEGDTITLYWSASDALTDVDHFALYVSVNGAAYQALETNLSRTTTSYQYAVTEGQLLVFKLTVSDIVGNEKTVKSAMYTRGYEFPNSYIYPLFLN
jgi:hypothetical protein